MHQNTKVYYMGKRVFFGNQYKKMPFPLKVKVWIADKITRLVRLIIVILKVASIGGVVGGMFYLTFLAGQFSAPTYIQAQVTQKEELPEKIEQLKVKLANIIHQGESGGKKMKDGEIFSVFDPSDSMRSQCMKANTVRPIDCESYGPYQIKIGTLMHYAPQVYGHTINQMEAMRIANTEAEARNFFVECSIKVPGCAWNWTVARNHKAEVQILIDTIRELQK